MGLADDTLGDLSAFGDTIELVMAEIRQKFRDASQHEGVFQALRRFAAAVDWTEPWLLGLLAFQATLLLATVLLRNSQVVAWTVLAVGASIVYCGERINGLLARHWKAFAKQPYFDKSGIFFSAVVSVPWLLAMFFILVHYLLKTSGLLIRLKRRELLHKARQRARADRQGQQQEGSQPGSKKDA